MEFETILFAVEDHVATVTLNRPQAMNAFNQKMLDEFAALWEHVRYDDDIHVVVLRAADGRAFCTGADVKDRIHFPSNVWSMEDPGTKLGPKLNRVWKPVVAAVHGLCAGGAAYWINESDIVICSDDAEFFDPHVTYGLVSALEPIGMRYRAHLGDVLRMALLGNDERICAQTALRIGLVSEVVARERLWARADEIARIIAAKPAAAIQGTVRAIWESLDMPRSAALNTGMAYTHIGNPLGRAERDRDAMMTQAKPYQTR